MQPMFSPVRRSAKVHGCGMMSDRFVNKFEAKSLENPTRLTGELPPTSKQPPQNGYQPTSDNLDRSKPPQQGSGVPNLKSTVTRPVCGGTGHVDAGFYLQTQGSSSAGGTEPCRSCAGRGYVVV